MTTPEFMDQFGQTVTVGIGFVIFYIILRKYAWGPILDLLEARQKKIEDGFEEVKKLQADASEAHTRYEEKLRNIEAEAREKIQEEINAAKRVATEMTDAARVEANAIKEKAKESVQMELATARKQLREDVIELTLTAASKILEEKMDDARDRALVESFVSELENRSS